MTSRRGETTNQTDGSSFKRDSSVKMMSNFLHQGETRVEEGWIFFYLRRCVDQSFEVHSEWVYMQPEAFNENYSLPTAVDKATPDRQISLVESGKRLHTFIWLRRSVIWVRRSVIWVRRSVIWVRRSVIWVRRSVIWVRRSYEFCSRG